MRSILLDSVDSTNDYLKRKTNSDTEPFLFVRTQEQLAGKGRLGRTWISGKNNSFIVSVLIPFHSNSFQAGFIAAASIIKIIRQTLQIKCSIKWPNDIYLNGKKLGGVLAEKYGEKLILGIGINVNQENFNQNLKETAISLYQAIKKPIPISDIFNCFKLTFYQEYQDWLKDPSFYIQDKIAPQICWIGKKIKIDLMPEGTIEGILKGIDSQGFLIIQTNNLQKTITTGDLKLWLQE